VKEIPTVKVLDASDVPEKRSYPPRLGIILAGTLFAFGAGAAWILGIAAWEGTDSHDLRKVFAQEVFTTLRARLPGFLQNGSRTLPATASLRAETAGARESDSR